MKMPSVPQRKQPPVNNAFLLRCWQRDGAWRFMLEDVRTRERQLFDDVDEMARWLTAVLPPATAAQN